MSSSMEAMNDATVIDITKSGNPQVNDFPSRPATVDDEEPQQHEQPEQPQLLQQSEEQKSVEQDVWPSYANPNYVMPDEIEVKISTISGDYSFPVGIVKKSTPKQYFGGYKNTVNGKHYHHANSQTPTESKGATKETSKLRTRNTQTFDQRTISVQPVREHGTQMQRIDLYIDDSKDIECIPKPYLCADDLLFKKKQQALEIQRIWRGYMARCRAIRLRHNIVQYEVKHQQDLASTMQLHREQKLAEMQQRTHPKSNADFATLFNELDTWRKGEVVKIKAATKPGEERRAAMSDLLNQETKALQHIERLKAVAYKTVHAEKTEKLLELMAQPQKWQLADGEIASVQTPETLRAKELLDLYQALNQPLSNTNERLEILLNVKWTVKESLPQSGGMYAYNHGSYNKDIIDLVDREADLLNRGRPYKSMESLRHRISNLFLQYIENPIYNPRASEFINIPLPVPPPAT